MRRNLIWAFASLLCLSFGALGKKTETFSVNDSTWKRVRLVPNRAGHDLTLEILGRVSPLVASLDIKLKFYEKSSDSSQLKPPPASGAKAPPLKWLLCGSSSAYELRVKINWKKGADEKGSLILEVDTEDTRYAPGQEWTVKSADWQYRRLTWPANEGGQKAAAVGVTSKDVLPAVACVSHTCAEMATLSPSSENCKPFNSTVWFKSSTTSLPSYLFMRLTNMTEKPNTNVGKSVTLETRRGSEADIGAWVASLAKAPRPAGDFVAQKTGKTSVPGAQVEGEVEAYASRGQAPIKQQILPAAGAGSKGMATAAAAGTAVVAASQPAGSSGVISSNMDGSSQSISASNNGSPSVSVVYNYNIGSDAESARARPVPPLAATVTALATEAPPVSLEEQLSGAVTDQAPASLRFDATAARAQGGPLAFELTSNGTVHAVLMVQPEPKLLSILSPSGGRAQLQLCPRQLTDEWLDVTFTTPSGRPVGFNTRLYQPDTELSLGVPREVELAPNATSVHQLTFPDYDSSMGLEVNSPPATCLRASVFKKMCAALAGKLKDAVSHKYLSSGDYLPVANLLDHSRRAFLRTEWASPEKCGLPGVSALASAAAAAAAAAAAGAAGAGAPLSALLRLKEHEDSDVWPFVLLPPIALAMTLPAILFGMVRSAAARWRGRGGGSSAGGGVTISELPETPRLPRHVPRLLGSPSCEQKPALLPAGPGPSSATTATTPSPAPAATVTMSLVTEAGYADLSEEKRRLAAFVRPVYPDLSEEQRQEVAAAEAEEEEEETEGGAEKARLAAQLGVGGRPARPSAPVGAEDADSSRVALLEAERPRAVAAVRRSGSDASGAPLVEAAKASDGLSGPLAVTHHVSTLTLCGFAAAVLSVTTYFSATALTAFLGGDVGTCGTSPHYTVISSALPGVSGLVNLIPTVTYAACIWFLRNSWERRAAQSLLDRGIAWPAPGLEWLLMTYGVQSAISGLCPGNSVCFTDNTFAVAFLGVLAVSRAPTVRPALPLAAAVTGSALMSAGGWLPGATLPRVTTAVAAAGQLGAAGYLYSQLLLPADCGRLPAVQQAQLLVPAQVAVLLTSQLATAALGVFLLSPAGYLALTGLTTLLTTLWLTRHRKGTLSVSTPLTPFAWLFELVGSASLFSAIVLGEVAYSGKLGTLEASSIGQLLYLVSCTTLALGVSPRPMLAQ